MGVLSRFCDRNRIFYGFFMRECEESIGSVTSEDMLWFLTDDFQTLVFLERGGSGSKLMKGRFPF